MMTTAELLAIEKAAQAVVDNPGKRFFTTQRWRYLHATPPEIVLELVRELKARRPPDPDYAALMGKQAK